PSKDDPQATTSGTPVRIDARTGVANQGTVQVLERSKGGWQTHKSIKVGLHPCALAFSPKQRFLYVANANSDTVSVIDTAAREGVETIRSRRATRLPFGSGPNALAVSPSGATLYVANGTNNCVAVVRLAAGSSDGTTAQRPKSSRVAGLIPTG